MSKAKKNSNGSLIKSSSVKLFPEVALGYLLGPMLALISNGIINTYLVQYYNSVLGLQEHALLFETLLPILSSIIIVIGNLLIGRLINRKPSAAGKARPLILLSLPFLAIALFLLFWVPMIGYNDAGDPKTPSIWALIYIAVGYNFYYAFAYPFYYTPHSSLVNLSTRDSSARSLNATASNAALLGSAGLAGMIGPMLVDLLGLLPKEAGQDSFGRATPAITAKDAHNKWTILMVVLIVFLVIGCLLEYYFTRERITEESLALDDGKKDTSKKEEKKVSMGEQARICVHDKYWWFIIIFYFLYQFGGMMKNSGINFYAQSFAPDHSMGAATIITTVGAIPTALGMLVIWPLANKIGKAKCIKIGAVIAALMGLAGFVVLIPSISNNQAAVTTVSTISFALKALGTVPAMYISMALMSDVLDHQEAMTGKRTDGFTMAIYGSIIVAMTGIANGIIIGLNGAFPWSKDAPEANRTALTIATYGVEALCYVVIFFLFLGMDVEKFSKLDHRKILENQKAEVLKEGGVWIDPEERERQEEEKNNQLVEEARREELKAKCEKKHLNFEEEEKKYQEAKAKKDLAAKAKKDAQEKKAAEKAALEKRKYDALPQAKKDALKAKEEAIELEFNKQLEKAQSLAR